MRSTANKFNIPFSTMRDKVMGNSTQVVGHINTGRILTDAEEEVMFNWIQGCSKRAMPVTKRLVLKALDDILEVEEELGYERTHLDRTKKHNRWWRNFKLRYPKIVYRTPESLSTSRKNLSERIIRQWYSDTHSYLANQDLLDILKDDVRVFNLDEMGVGLSPKLGKVLGIKGDKYCFEDRSKFEKTQITVLSVIQAYGSIPPPMIIYPRKRIAVGIARKFPNLPFCVGKTETGWITKETFYEFVCNSFSDWLTKNHIQRPVILFTDWHETRNNFFLARQLTKLGIIMLGLPPNTTHLMQPLDVAVIGPLKRKWTQAVRTFTDDNPDDIISQINFAPIFLPVYYKAITQANIKSGFRACGLYPFNPDAPDYGKLEAAAAQREHRTSMFQGVNQGKKLHILLH